MGKTMRSRLERRGRRLAAPPPPEKEFFRWFFEDVLGLTPEEGRREFWREARRTGHTLGPVPVTMASRSRAIPYYARGLDDVLTLLAIGGAALAFWFIRAAVRRHARSVRRPLYYARERERRLALAAERRRAARRATSNPCPGVGELRALHARARSDPEAALRLGGLLEDLECHLDSRPRVVGGVFRGRAGGILRHLEREAPDLFAHYKSLMRRKALARRLRQACGVSDPDPADALLPARPSEPAVREVDGVRFPARPSGPGEAQQRVAAAVLREGAGSVVAVEAALALRLDPDCIPPERGHGGAADGAGPARDAAAGAAARAAAAAPVGRGRGTRDGTRPRTPKTVLRWLWRRRGNATETA